MKKEFFNSGIHDGVCEMLLIYNKINKRDDIEVDKNKEVLFFVKSFFITQIKKM